MGKSFPEAPSATANARHYDVVGGASYTMGEAPHLRHPSLRRLYDRLTLDVLTHAKTRRKTPTVIDLGAGEGSTTIRFLDLGAEVVAVDVSQRQLDALRERCRDHRDRLRVVHGDVTQVLDQVYAAGERFDVIVANAFLHHVPDYLGLIRACDAAVVPGGQFFSFQDPMRYSTLDRSSRFASVTAYATWRLGKGDVLGGLARRLRRSRGIFLEDLPHDVVEFHMVRDGVDQEAIRSLLSGLGYSCSLVKYFSAPSAWSQRVGESLGLADTFAVRATKRG